MEEIDENIEKYGTDYLKYKFFNPNDDWGNMTSEYSFGSDDRGNFLMIVTQRDPGDYSIGTGAKFRKVP